MPSPIRIERLSALILRRAAEVINYELNDPRCRLITLTRVKLARDMATCLISYSVLGDEGEVRLAGRLLEHARGYIQREVARILHTRVVPRLSFQYDPSVIGSIHVSSVIDAALAEDRAAHPELMQGDEEGTEDFEGSEHEDDDDEPRDED